MIHTSCQDCCFRKETACKLDKLNKYLERKEARLVEEDDDKYYVVDRLCPFFRNKNSDWKDSEDLQQLKLKVNDEIKIKINLCIICPDNFNISDLEKTLASAEKNKLKFKKFYVGLATNRPKTRLVFDTINKFKDIKYKVSLIVNKQKSREVISDILFSHMTKKECSHVMFVDVGAEIESDFVEKLNNSLTVDMDKWIMITPCLDEENRKLGPLVQFHLYDKLGGNAPAVTERINLETKEVYDLDCTKIEQKIGIMCKDDGVEHLIGKYEDYISN